MRKYSEKARVSQKRKRALNRTKSLHLLGGKCVKCGSIKNLQFDHINPKTKAFLVSNLFSSSEKTLMSELKKCQLLCQGCHTKKTLKEFGKVLATEQHGTTTSYTHGKCRCVTCKKFWNEKVKVWKKASLAKRLQRSSEKGKI